MPILPDNGPGGSAGPTTGKLRHVTASGENSKRDTFKEISENLLRDIHIL